MTTTSLRQTLERQQGQKIEIEKSIADLKHELRHKNRSLQKHEEAREIIRIVGAATQSQISYHISDITSLALEAVFNDPYTLEVEFIQRRNKTECDLFFVRNGNRVNPMDGSGGGTVDVAAFALRIASWSMSRPRTMNTIVLDEPLRYLSVDCQEKASAMIKELSKKLGLQFIIVSHEQTLASYADRIFETTIKKGITTVTQS